MFDELNTKFGSSYFIWIDSKLDKTSPFGNFGMKGTFSVDFRQNMIVILLIVLAK